MDSQLLPGYRGSRLQYQLRQGMALRSLGTWQDENAQPFAGGNEQFAGRSDPLLLACSQTPNTVWISDKAQRETELDACLAQEFNACLSLGVPEVAGDNSGERWDAADCQAPAKSVHFR